jgi:hypothetical protein
VVVLAAVLALVLRHPAAAKRPGVAAGGQQIASENLIRGQAVAWVTSQVGRDIDIGCDGLVCSDLARHGFPAGNLTTISPTAPDPYGSQLVIATADIRSQFGSKLATVYAPEVIASFGAGTSRIDIRVIIEGGATAFQTALAKDLQARKSSGAQLLRNSKIVESAAATQTLRQGQVDERLLTAIAFLAAQQPLSITGFGGAAPGAGPEVPLRYVYLAESDAAAGESSAAYLKALIAGARGLRPPYVPLSVSTAPGTAGQNVLRIEFAAPSPLNLLP